MKPHNLTPKQPTKLKTLYHVWLYSTGSMACLLIPLCLLTGELHETNELIRLGEIISGSIASYIFMCLSFNSVRHYVIK